MVLALDATMNFVLGLWLGLAVGIVLGMLLFALFEIGKRRAFDGIEFRLATRNFFRRTKDAETNHVPVQTSVDRAAERDRQRADNHH